MANKTLTASVRLDTRSAEKSLDSLTKKIKKVETTINKVGSSTKLKTNIDKAVMSQEKLKQAVAKTALAEEKVRTQKERTKAITEKIKRATDKTVTSANKLKGAFSSANASANGLLTTVKRLASTYLGIMGAKAIITTSDTITSAQNRLNALEGGSPAYTSKTMDKTYQAAQRSRSSYSDMLSNVSKTMTLASDAFNDNVDNAIRFQEIMAKAYAVGGASAAEQSSSMYQLVQALGSGVLQGDELRSVREGAPLAYKKIEEFAQGVLDTEESLKKLASEGKITSGLVVAAIMDAGDAIDNQFENTSMTFAQAWDKIKNAAVKAFEPISNILNETLNKFAENGTFEKIEAGFVQVAKAIHITFYLIGNAIKWIAENWNWLKIVLITGLILYISYLIVVTAISVAQAIIRISLWLAEYGLLLLLVFAVLLLAVVFYLWKSAAIDTCTAIGLALLAVAAIVFFFFGWQAALIVAAVGLIIMYLEYVVGAIYATCALVYNILIGVINAIIQLIWTALAEPFIGIIEWMLNACMGGFDSFGGAVANLVGQIIGWFLSLGKVVTTIIDAIFGTNWTAGLESLKSAVQSWGKNKSSISISREAPTIGRISYTDAWNLGVSHGNKLKDVVNNWGSQFQSPDYALSLDKIGNALGMDLSDHKLATNPPLNYDAPEDLLKLPNDVGKIADNTGDISDSLDLTNEDLDYLRRIADMEWKKEFTTANITVDMSNYNTINGDNDLDGIVTKLADKLYDEMHSVANGVYV